MPRLASSQCAQEALLELRKQLGYSEAGYDKVKFCRNSRTQCPLEIKEFGFSVPAATMRERGFKPQFALQHEVSQVAESIRGTLADGQQWFPWDAVMPTQFRDPVSGLTMAWRENKDAVQFGTFIAR